MRTPAELYRASPRRYAGLPDIIYPLHDRDVVVAACGRICMQRIKLAAQRMPQRPARKDMQPNTLSSPRNGVFAPFVRPTPQSDPWRHDRGRIVS
jgi:hypothetical protein